MSRGFSLVELLVVLATISVLMAITVPMMQSAMLRAHVGAMATDARAIHDAFKQHYIDNNLYPNAIDPPAFELDTFEPLVGMGYYDGRVASKLLGMAADAYDSPDDLGNNQEFWLELTLAADPSVRFLVADSDDAPLSGGADMDGIYFYRNGVLTSLSDPVWK
jgi:prepilin-type N-terminal cleavage/methylation domain-containing protein